MTLFEISESALAEYKANLNKAKEGFDLSDFVNARKPSRVDSNGIGFVYVYGALLRDSTPIDRALGNTDYAQITADLESVVKDGAKAVVLVVDSGGGTVAGGVEAAKAIQGLPIPVVGFVSGTAASAGYKLLSAATHIVATESATVGNIGSILVYLDATAAHAAMGVTLGAFVNDGATLKSTGHLDGFTDEQRAFLQDSINEAGTNFQTFVLENRPDIDPETFKAGWFSGKRALTLGLIDSIGSEAHATAIAVQLAETFFDESL